MGVYSILETLGGKSATRGQVASAGLVVVVLAAVDLAWKGVVVAVCPEAPLVARAALTSSRLAGMSAPLSAALGDEGALGVVVAEVDIVVGNLQGAASDLARVVVVRTDILHVVLCAEEAEAECLVRAAVDAAWLGLVVSSVVPRAFNLHGLRLRNGDVRRVDGEGLQGAVDEHVDLPERGGLVRGRSDGTVMVGVGAAAAVGGLHGERWASWSTWHGEIGKCL